MPPTTSFVTDHLDVIAACLHRRQTASHTQFLNQKLNLASLAFCGFRRTSLTVALACAAPGSHSDIEGGLALW